MTPAQCRLLVDAFEVDRLLADDEGVEILSQENPELLDVYRALFAEAEKS